MRDYTGAGGLMQAIKDGAELEDEEWAKLYDSATPYQRRCARLILDPTCAPHGVPGTYTNWGCRCDLCRIAYNELRRGRATLEAFEDDPGQPDEPEQIAKLRELAEAGHALTAKGRKMLDDWDAAHVI